MSITIIKSTNKKPKPDFNNLGFGKFFTDHMFEMSYTKEQGWHGARVTPYAPLELDPATCVLHYGQALFEGMKAYKGDDGSVFLFRPKENFARLNRGCSRICIDNFDEELVLEGLKELVNIDRDWIPSSHNSALYIRPFVMATDVVLGVHPSASYKLLIIMSPVGSYYAGGMAPIDILVEDEYVRSVAGGTGDVKVIGNYAASLKAQQKAENAGYSQVLWLDGIHRKYAEEVGSMNIFFAFNGELVTPRLTGSILPGITRKSVIQLCEEMGIKVAQRDISIEEIFEAAKSGELTECFGTGTAVVVAPVGGLCYKGEKAAIGGNKIGSITQKLYDRLTGIQYGNLQDDYGWRATV